MYIFNPEHDLCLANGDIHYVPPQSALRFGLECASLTRFMHGLDSLADSDNISYPSCIPTDTAKISAENLTKINKIIPWGWNSVLCNRLLKEGFPPELLPPQEQLQAIKALSHRETALDAHTFVCQRIASLQQETATDNIHTHGNKITIRKASIGSTLTPADYRIAAKTVEEVENFLQKHGNIVLKAPLSGSGKGIRFVTDSLSHSDAGWCRNLIQRHGCVIVEQRFAPILECAMLFECTNNKCCNHASQSCISDGKTDNTSVIFKGYSLFYASNGMYSGNILASNEYIEKEIVKSLSGADIFKEDDKAKKSNIADMLEEVKNALMEYLQKNVAPRYSGFVGVDQFVYQAFNSNTGCTDINSRNKKENCNNLFFNPVVEINLRMTMGLLARNIYDRFAGKLLPQDNASCGDPQLLQDGSHCFEIVHSKARVYYQIAANPVRDYKSIV